MHCQNEAEGTADVTKGFFNKSTEKKFLDCLSHKLQNYLSTKQPSSLHFNVIGSALQRVDSPSRRSLAKSSATAPESSPSSSKKSEKKSSSPSPSPAPVTKKPKKGSDNDSPPPSKKSSAPSKDSSGEPPPPKKSSKADKSKKGAAEEKVGANDSFQEAEEHTRILAIAIASTAAGTFFFALIVFCCCCLAGRSKKKADSEDDEDDSPIKLTSKI